MKYTGSRGKGGSSDASAEFVAKIRDIFDSNAETDYIIELFICQVFFSPVREMRGCHALAHKREE